jgi:hypothetical protein
LAGGAGAAGRLLRRASATVGNIRRSGRALAEGLLGLRVSGEPGGLAALAAGAAGA